MASIITQILNFKANFHKEFELFKKKNEQNSTHKDRKCWPFSGNYDIIVLINFNQKWKQNGNSEEYSIIIMHVSYNCFIFGGQKAISFWKLCLELRTCARIAAIFKGVCWLSIQWLQNMKGQKWLSNHTSTSNTVVIEPSYLHVQWNFSWMFRTYKLPIVIKTFF